MFTKALFKWNKINSTALGLIQGKLNPALWPDYVDVGDAAMFWTHLETKYGKARGACQIGIEISDCTGDKISVGVARPSHVSGQSVPCDR